MDGFSLFLQQRIVSCFPVKQNIQFRLKKPWLNKNSSSDYNLPYTNVFECGQRSREAVDHLTLKNIG